jgi:hypothetical protein
MQWGTEKEPDARAAYEFQTDTEVAQVGFAPHPSISASGASPDGLVGDDGLVEIKCPNTATHIDTLLGNEVPAKYITQMLWQMACTGRKWCDFVSFDPRLPESMRLFVRRVHRHDAEIARLEDLVIQFLGELDQKTSDLIRIYEPDFPSGAVASAAASDEGTRAKAAPPQHGDPDMGGAAQPAKPVPGALTGQEAYKLKTSLLTSVRQLTTVGDFLSWAKDARVHIDRLPVDMQAEIDTEFQRCQGYIAGKN